MFLSGNIVFVFRKISNTHLTTCCILHSHVNLTGNGRSCQEIQRYFSLLAKTTKTSQNQAHSVHLTASNGWLMHFCGDRKGCFALFSPPGTGNRSHATVIMMMYWIHFPNVTRGSRAKQYLIVCSRSPIVIKSVAGFLTYILLLLKVLSGSEISKLLEEFVGFWYF